MAVNWLAQPVTMLKGVGPAMADKLAKLHLHTQQDLLFHLPMRYQDRTRVTPIARLQMMDDVVIEGTITSQEVKHGRRRSLFCRLRDDSGIIALRFFSFNQGIKDALKVGATLRVMGEVRQGSSGLEMYHPECFNLERAGALPYSESLTPIYPLTEGVHQNKLRQIIAQVTEKLQSEPIDSPILPELIPPNIVQQYGFGALSHALLFLHAPPTDVSVEKLEEGEHPCQQRLAFEELVAHHLSLLKLRQSMQAQTAPAVAQSTQILPKFLGTLPFSPTGAQQRVTREIEKDLARPYPMLRLVQGDVGSGKTLVAAMAALHAIESGYQVALMAPTEILAEQHFVNFQKWFEPLGIEVAWLAGKLKGKKREAQLTQITSGSAKMVVGTHALFQDDVAFHSLGLVIIDEQHRFGVHQRLALLEKGANHGTLPHQLIMTATPIPRTLAMSAYADLDCSVIDELPPGRTPVNTVVISDDRRDDVIQRIHQACYEGKQVYWVCTLIEESEALEAQAAEATAQLLSENLPDVSIGLVHGRMKPTEKAEVMQAFKEARTQLLVATTVIEVGVDVPNASLMIIENPERLGLAQLHQLRGRVGRGSIASHCVLLYKRPLSAQGKERLGVMRETNDGFIIAEKDLALRGPGEVLGTRQTGAMLFKVADLERDEALLPDVKTCCQTLIAQYPQVCDALLMRWIGSKDQFGMV